jgi:hypothetical protein
MPRAPLAFVRCLVFGPFLAASGVAAQEVKLDYDPAADFTKYKTFGWSLAQEPAKNPANHVRITRAVEANLATRGVTKATDGAPDLYLTYSGKVGEKVKVTGKSAGSYWEPSNLRTTVDVGKVKAGTLILEMTDARAKDVVWRGVATTIGIRPDLMEEEITAAVKKLLEGYPPTKAKAAPPELPKP